MNETNNSKVTNATLETTEIDDSLDISDNSSSSNLNLSGNLFLTSPSISKTIKVSNSPIVSSNTYTFNYCCSGDCESINSIKPAVYYDDAVSKIKEIEKSFNNNIYPTMIEYDEIYEKLKLQVHLNYELHEELELETIALLLCKLSNEVESSSFEMCCKKIMDDNLLQKDYFILMLTLVPKDIYFSDEFYKNISEYKYSDIKIINLSYDFPYSFNEYLLKQTNVEFPKNEYYMKDDNSAKYLLYKIITTNKILFIRYISLLTEEEKDKNYNFLERTIFNFVENMSDIYYNYYPLQADVSLISSNTTLNTNTNKYNKHCDAYKTQINKKNFIQFCLRHIEIDKDSNLWKIAPKYELDEDFIIEFSSKLDFSSPKLKNRTFKNKELELYKILQ